MKWSVDSFGERRISDFGAQYETKEVGMSEIDFEASSQNHARLIDPISEETVLEYALALERGDVFPYPIVLARKGSKKYLILSGNHRLRGARMVDENAKVICYVVYSDDELIADLLPRILNRGHGKKQEKDEAIEQAIYICKKYGYAQAHVESLFGLRPGTMSIALRTREMKEHLSKSGVNADKLTATTLGALCPLKNDNVLVAAARVILQKGMNSISASPFIADVKKERSEAAQMTVIGEYAEKAFPDAVKKGPRELTNRHRFLLALGHMEKSLNGHRSLSQLQITDRNEAKEVRARVRNLNGKLAKIAG